MNALVPEHIINSNKFRLSRDYLKFKHFDHQTKLNSTTNDNTLTGVAVNPKLVTPLAAILIDIASLDSLASIAANVAAIATTDGLYSVVLITNTSNNNKTQTFTHTKWKVYVAKKT